MIAWLEALPTAASGAILIGGFTIAMMLFGVLVRNIAPRESRRKHNDLAGFILAVVGVIYAVLLAFVAVGVWERFDQAEIGVSNEAAAIQIVYRDAASFPQHVALRGALRGYVEQVIEREWPAMEHGGMSRAAERSGYRTDGLIRGLTVKTASQSNIQARMLDAFDRALMDRDVRLSIRATGIHPLMWFVLVVGGVITVGFTYLFGFEEIRLEIAMTGTLSLLIGLVLFLTLALDFPFRGGITVTPDAFVRALESFHAIGS